MRSPGDGTKHERNRQDRYPGLPSCPPEVLVQIERARLSRDEAEAELTALIDQAVGMGIGWPEIAARLGVTRQAARQRYQRRHRGGASRQDRVA